MGSNKSMRPVIDTFPEYTKKIEILYADNRIFKEVCDHYSVCAKALECWKRSKKKEAAARRIEYEELLGSLQEEIRQYLIK